MISGKSDQVLQFLAKLAPHFLPLLCCAAAAAAATPEDIKAARKCGEVSMEEEVLAVAVLVAAELPRKFLYMPRLAKSLMDEGGGMPRLFCSCAICTAAMAAEEGVWGALELGGREP